MDRRRVSGDVPRLAGDGLYGTLLDITGTRVVVDVVTGASAGGLNGAFLAAGRARDLPSSVFDGLRAVWLTAGSFQELLRNPLSRKQRNPPSLLRWDEFFLRKIEDVLLNWFGTSEPPPRGVDDDPFELVLTATRNVANLRSGRTRLRRSRVPSPPSRPIGISSLDDGQRLSEIGASDQT